MRHKPDDVVKDEATYIFLIKDVVNTPKLNPAQRKKEVNEVNNFVKKEGGQCRLFSTPGGAFDFVSVISGVGPAVALRIAAEIEKRGTVKATLISGVEVFDGAK
jgi:uncharacterized protein with GYD domain